MLELTLIVWRPAINVTLIVKIKNLKNGAKGGKRNVSRKQFMKIVWKHATNVMENLPNLIVKMKNPQNGAKSGKTYVQNQKNIVSGVGKHVRCVNKWSC